MSNTTTLYCKAGHKWERPKQRGRKPLYCPEHQPVVEETSDVQTLTCKAGHSWTRPSQRGKKPIWCPEHKPVVVKTSNGRRGRPRKEDGPITNPYDLNSLVEKYHPGDEDLRKLTYIDRELGRDRELADLRGLLKTQKLIVATIARSVGEVIVVEDDE